MVTASWQSMQCKKPGRRNLLGFGSVLARIVRLVAEATTVAVARAVEG